MAGEAAGPGPANHGSETRATGRGVAVGAGGLCLAVALLAGCADKGRERPPSAYERQQEALRDPFSYSPHFRNQPAIGGGEMWHMDKEAMQEDLDRVYQQK